MVVRGKLDKLEQRQRALGLVAPCCELWYSGLWTRNSMDL